MARKGLDQEEKESWIPAGAWGRKRKTLSKKTKKGRTREGHSSIPLKKGGGK